MSPKGVEHLNQAQALVLDYVSGDTTGGGTFVFVIPSMSPKGVEH